MAIIQRFSTIRRGGIIFTGNTAGLAPMNATSGRYGTRHGVGRIFGKCDTCAHLQSVVAVVGHQPCRLDVCGGLRGLLAAASQSDSVVRSVGGSLDAGSTDIPVAECVTCPDGGVIIMQQEVYRA